MDIKEKLKNKNEKKSKYKVVNIRKIVKWSIDRELEIDKIFVVRKRID